MTDLEIRSRRMLIKAGILTTASLILAPAAASAAPPLGIESCTGRPTEGIRAPLTGPAVGDQRPRFVNPWIDPKGDFRP